MNRFDNYEFHPCRLLVIEKGIEVVEQCDEKDEDIYIWSVYGHFRLELREENGCLECLYDFSNKRLAELCCESLNKGK